MSVAGAVIGAEGVALRVRVEEAFAWSNVTVAALIGRTHPVGSVTDPDGAHLH